MIDVYYWPTPNGHKILIFLEESGLRYRIIPIDLSAGEQHSPAFVNISPSGKMPAIVDTEPADGEKPVAVFESGAILLYLAEKSGLFMPTDLRRRSEVIEWLFWQVAGLGPAAGQYHHFSSVAGDRRICAEDYFHDEVGRLFEVLDWQLGANRFVVGDTYTIADMALFPWVTFLKRKMQGLSALPNLRRWEEEVRRRPATIQTYLIAAHLSTERKH
jgi:GST-like protein